MNSVSGSLRGGLFHNTIRLNDEMRRLRFDVRREVSARVGIPIVSFAQFTAQLDNNRRYGWIADE